MINRIALGTVQFGMSYGIASQVGQVSREETALILDNAWAAGIDTLDTAIEYGASEQRLGEIGVDLWKVVSKLPKIPENCVDICAWVNKSVSSSLKRLKISRLHGLLLHYPEQLLGPHGDTLYKSLDHLRSQGIVKKIGISIYAPSELDAIYPYFQFDLVQAPFNILDRRIVKSGWLAKLREARVEIHTRSAFLQGLLLMENTKRPKTFNHWHNLWEKWHHWLDDQTLAPIQACLGFAFSQPEIDRVVVGVDNSKQLHEIIAVGKINLFKFPDDIESDDIRLINPTEWRDF